MQLWLDVLNVGVNRWNCGWMYWMWELIDATVTGCKEQPALSCVDNTANDRAYRSQSSRSPLCTVSRPEGAICTAHWFTKRPNAASCSAGRVLQSLPGARGFRTTLTTACISYQSRPSPLPSMSLPIHYLLIITTLNGIEAELVSRKKAQANKQTSKQTTNIIQHSIQQLHNTQYSTIICHFTVYPIHTLASKCPSSGAAVSKKGTQ